MTTTCKLKICFLTNQSESSNCYVFRVEYTDCFGRSRRISRRDLSKVKQQDDELSNVVESREQQPHHNIEAVKSPAEESNESEEIGPDIGLQFMKQREEWQQQEEINKERTSLHYQDILFDGRFDLKH